MKQEHVSKDVRQAVAFGVGIAVFSFGEYLYFTMRGGAVETSGGFAEIFGVYSLLAGFGAGTIVNYWLSH